MVYLNIMDIGLTSPHDKPGLEAGIRLFRRK
jgi:hypothetical protein